MVYYNHSKGIHKVLVKSTGISEEFTKLNFKPSAYKSKDGRMLREKSQINGKIRKTY